MVEGAEDDDAGEGEELLATLLLITVDEVMTGELDTMLLLTTDEVMTGELDAMLLVTADEVTAGELDTMLLITVEEITSGVEASVLLRMGVELSLVEHGEVEAEEIWLRAME
ncbi:hypothetical protein SLS60_011634 [Paraconiothyrium brasiliense]|uniref:Uncharacterized protein n=1 Tax=Paraconiothyrium brasiliense TaxID=300254 RepID=A0ABR3QIR0_9PLEO